MSSEIINLRHLLFAGLAAGIWVLVSGLLMAGVFGYRDMKAAFDAVGLPIPSGTAPFIVHALVRLLMGIGVVALFAIFARVLSRNQALLAAAGFI